MVEAEFDPASRIAFSIHENKGVFALLLGSGVSRASDIPTGWEITLDLVRRLAVLEGVENKSDWEKWYQDTYSEQPDYSKLVERLASTPAERRSILHSYIEPNEQERADGLKVPTEAHRAVARLVRSGHLKVIVTTNFDRLLENALREQGIEPTIVSSPDALKGAEPITHSECYVLKLHGDYKDARILNTDVELGDYDPAIDAVLDRILDEFGLIVLGWSGEWDAALRRAILRAPNRRYPMYWATRGKPSDAAVELIKARKAQVIQIANADEFLSKTTAYVEVLDRSRKQNPRDLEMLIKLTKRYLAGGPNIIDLTDLVDTQLEALLREIRSESLAPKGNWSTEEFVRRASQYEDISEPLMRIFGVLGRFGNGSEFQIIESTLKALYAESYNNSGGLVRWLNLVSYPAVLLYMSYCTALAEARRFETLRLVFDIRLFNRHDEARRLVDTLHLWSWSGAENEMWQQYPELERRHTAFSDHATKLITNIAGDVVGPAGNSELAYERFETLGSLAVFDSNSVEEMKSRLEPAEVRPLNRNDGIWMPMGRSGWNSNNRNKIFHEFDDPRIQQAMFDAGFSQGSVKVLEFFKKNFLLLAGWFR